MVTRPVAKWLAVPALIILIALASVVLLPGQPTHASPGVTTLVSGDSAGVQGDSWSQFTALSADGPYVAFAPAASPSDARSLSDDPTLLSHTVSAGHYHNCGVRTDGTLACWGSNGNGRATPPTGTIVIVKATDPAGGTGFGFTDLTCTDPDGGSSVDLGARKATIDLDAGETVTWTFTNTAPETPTPTHTPTPVIYTVDSTGDGVDTDWGDLLCDDGAGHCTLRAAIEEANADGAESTIWFNIRGKGVRTITPGSALPTITQPVTIDGTTQPGYAGAPIIELNGASAGANAAGLYVTGGLSTVQGLVINRFADGFSNGVLLASSGNVIRGNYIGTNVGGTVALGNGNAVLIDNVANNTIGGTTPAARNVMSGNNANGILILGGSATGNVVQGNYIGTDVTGTVDLGNTFSGVGILNSASGNTIGGTAPGAGNVISGNGTVGVGCGAGGVPTGNQVLGNFIGTDPSGTLPLGNGGDGVGLNGSNNNVGGTASGARNTIAHNGGDGVSVSGGTGHAIRGNSIFSNTSLGIDLGPDGVTPNDAGDGDTGPNNLQNFPVLTSATSGSTTVQGTFNSTPTTQFTLEFFHGTSCDPSGNGEGEGFLGSTTVMTNGSGNASFSIAFPQTVPPGRFITATATDPGGNTSEFSGCIQATAGPTPTPTPTPGAAGCVFRDDFGRGTVLTVNGTNWAFSGPGLNVAGTGARLFGNRVFISAWVQSVMVGGSGVCPFGRGTFLAMSFRPFILLLLADVTPGG